MLRSRDRAGAEQELWALLALYQALRMAMTAAAESAGADPDRASFTTALEAARNQVTAARGVADSADPGDTGRIGRAVLDDLLPARRPRYSARKVKCSTSRYHVRDHERGQDRPCQSVTITRVQITIGVPPRTVPPRAPAARTNRPVPARPARAAEETRLPASWPASPARTGPAGNSRAGRRKTPQPAHPARRVDPPRLPLQNRPRPVRPAWSGLRRHRQRRTVTQKLPRRY